MKLFFVRHKGTKLYFPDPKGRSGRGGSFTEATDNGNDARIFRSARSAKIFLRAWVKGEYHCSRGGGQTWGGDYDYYEEVSIKPVPTRNLNDYEIIEKDIAL